jgi:hypothetical protein
MKVEQPYQVWDYANASIVYACPTLDAALTGVRREIAANGVDVARTWFLQKDDGNEIEIIAEEDDLVAMAQRQRPSTVRNVPAQNATPS